MCVVCHQLEFPVVMESNSGRFCVCDGIIIVCVGIPRGLETSGSKPGAWPGSLAQQNKKINQLGHCFGKHCIVPFKCLHGIFKLSTFLAQSIIIILITIFCTTMISSTRAATLASPRALENRFRHSHDGFQVGLALDRVQAYTPLHKNNVTPPIRSRCHRCFCEFSTWCMHKILGGFLFSI